MWLLKKIWMSNDHDS